MIGEDYLSKKAKHRIAILHKRGENRKLLRLEKILDSYSSFMNSESDTEYKALQQWLEQNSKNHFHHIIKKQELHLSEKEQIESDIKKLFIKKREIEFKLNSIVDNEMKINRDEERKVIEEYKLSCDRRFEWAKENVDKIIFNDLI